MSLPYEPLYVSLTEASRRRSLEPPPPSPSPYPPPSPLGTTASSWRSVRARECQTAHRWSAEGGGALRGAQSGGALQGAESGGVLEEVLRKHMRRSYIARRSVQCMRMYGGTVFRSRFGLWMELASWSCLAPWWLGLARRLELRLCTNQYCYYSNT